MPGYRLPGSKAPRKGGLDAHVDQFDLPGMNDKTFRDLDQFTQGYIEAMFFTNSGDSDDEIPAGYGFAELSPDAIHQCMKDCASFRADRKTQQLIDGRENEAGIDFWYTRNGHGAGFWDGDWDEDAGEYLTERAKKFGEAYVYLGDDGKVYLG